MFHRECAVVALCQQTSDDNWCKTKRKISYLQNDTHLSSSVEQSHLSSLIPGMNKIGQILLAAGNFHFYIKLF